MERTFMNIKKVPMAIYSIALYASFGLFMGLIGYEYNHIEFWIGMLFMFFSNIDGRIHGK